MIGGQNAFTPTAAQLERVEMLAAEGRSAAAVAADIGVGVATLRRKCLDAFQTGHARAPKGGPRGPNKNAVYARPSAAFAAAVVPKGNRSCYGR